MNWNMAVWQVVAREASPSEFPEASRYLVPQSTEGSQTCSRQSSLSTLLL